MFFLSLSHPLFLIDLAALCCVDSELNGRAWLLYAESVQPVNETVFLAVRTSGYNEFKKGNTDDAHIVPMGINCPQR